MAGNQVRWGFVGAGWMARAMAEDMAHVDGAVVHSVAARTDASAQAFGRDFSAKVFDSVEALAADEAVDVVYVNTPNHLHYPQVKAALEAGKPVLCEKPFTLNASELEELIRLARERKLFLMEAMWVRFLPTVVKLREHLAAGAIGEPFWLRANFHTQAPVDAGNRFYNLAMGGGALLDLGIYPISFASLVMGGQPGLIHTASQLANTGVDQHFGAVFQYDNGAMASLSAGFDGFFDDDLLIAGRKGRIRVERTGGWALDGYSIERGDQLEQVAAPRLGRGYGYQAEEVLRCLDAGLLESESMPLDESLAIMGTLDAMRAQWGMVFPGE
jgi:predicted dehydrogenase